MTKPSPILTGFTAGVVIGTATYMMTNHHRRHARTTHAIRRTTGRALRTVGNVIENMSYMMQ